MDDKQIQIFNFNNSAIRTVIDDLGNVWAVAKDVTEAMGYDWQNNLVSRVPEQFKGVKPINTLGGIQEMVVLSEAGLNFFAFRSDKPMAIPFQMWIASDLLPSVRKHGAYLTTDAMEQALTDPDFIIKLATQVKEERAAKLVAENQLAIAAPKVESYEKLMSSTDGVSIKEAAKVLGTGQNRLFGYLRGRRMIMSDNLPYQEHVDAGRFRVIEQKWTDSDGNVHPSPKTLITPKGMEYVRRLMKEVPV